MVPTGVMAPGNLVYRLLAIGMHFSRLRQFNPLYITMEMTHHSYRQTIFNSPRLFLTILTSDLNLNLFDNTKYHFHLVSAQILSLL